MDLHKYDSYEQYVTIQSTGNQKANISRVWVNERNIEFAVTVLSGMNIPLRFGICHGTRYGNEQKWFRKYAPSCQVIGTEISRSLAEEIPDTVCMDFQDTRAEWVGRADFIYSNAFDHTCDPARTMKVWTQQLNARGVIILEHTTGHEGEPTALDPFRATVPEMIASVPVWTDEMFHVLNTVNTPFRYKSHTTSVFLLIGSRYTYP